MMFPCLFSPSVYTSKKELGHSLSLDGPTIWNYLPRTSQPPSNQQIQTFIALNLHLLTDYKTLDPCCIQCHSPLTICLTAVGGNWSATEKTTLKSQSGTIPHKVAVSRFEPTLAKANWLMGEHSTN